MKTTVSMTGQEPERLVARARTLGARWTAAARPIAAGLAALAAVATLAPSAAEAMPFTPLPPVGSSAIVQVQGCGPPVRGVYIDAISGVQTEYWRQRPCPPGYGGGYVRPRPQYYEGRPRPRYYEERPRYYEERPAYRPAPRYYEDERAYRPRRPPPPGWERDPYTGRDTRILR